MLEKRSKLISAERKDKFKSARNEDIRRLSGNDHTTSHYLFGKKHIGKLKVGQGKLQIAQNVPNSKRLQAPV